MNRISKRRSAILCRHGSLLEIFYREWREGIPALHMKNYAKLSPLLFAASTGFSRSHAPAWQCLWIFEQDYTD